MGSERLIDVVEKLDVAADRKGSGCRVSFSIFSTPASAQRRGLGFFFDRVIGFCDKAAVRADVAVDRVIEIGRFVGRAADDERRARFVDQNRVHFVDDRRN